MAMPSLYLGKKDLPMCLEKLQCERTTISNLHQRRRDGATVTTRKRWRGTAVLRLPGRSDHTARLSKLS